MVRTRCLKAVDQIGQTAGGLISLVVVCFVFVAILVGECVAEAHKRRVLGPVCTGAIIAALFLVLVGCASTPKLDPRDPDVWRPTAPAVYPEPRQ